MTINSRFYTDDRPFTSTWIAPDQTVNATGSTAHVEIGGFDPLESDGRVEFSAPIGADLAVGTYDVSQSSPSATEGSIFVVLGSSGCYGVGTFDVLEAPAVDGTSQVTRFAAKFDVDCGNERHVGVVEIDPTVAVQALVLEPNDELAFGSSPVGVATAQQTLHVRNVGTTSTAVEGVTTAETGTSGSAPDSFLVDNACSSIAAGATCAIDIRFRPANDNNQFAWLDVSSDAFPMTQRIRLFGTGTLVPISNSTPDAAVVIGSLPFAHGGLPPPDTYSACGASGRSMWYRYTTATKRRVVFLSRLASSPPELFQGSLSSMTKLQCAPGQELEFTAVPGVTYWIHLVTQYPSTDRGIVKVTEGLADDAVALSSLGRTPATFYPYVDGYLDTMSITGNRGEPASVSVRIYSPAGKPVRALSAPSAGGPFTLKWNGKSSSGVLQPSGKYKLVIWVADTWGNVLTNTLYVSLSRKRLYTYTYSKTIDAGTYVAHGTTGTGRISRSGSAYTGGVRLSSGTSGAASVAYRFYAPSATVYKSVRFQALGVSRIPGIDVGLQKWSLCTSYSISCVGSWGSGPITYAWSGVKGGAANVSSGRQVRGYLYTSPYGGSSRYMDVRDVRIVVSYGILR